ncbi:radical SAM protein [Amylibacter sp.]|nr:radical SAM protein [Amylibacter sp.]
MKDELMSIENLKNELGIHNQEILVGSSKIQRDNEADFNPTEFSILNMEHNQAYKYFIKNNPSSIPDVILEDFKALYRDYRKEWIRRSKIFLEEDFGKEMNPLCVDIETAAICDLACSFCFRDLFFTPDTIIDLSFAKKLIDQAADMQVPSIKLNWRGEPLLYPKITELISYAKQKGILEVMINTNATTLTEKKSKELIEAGLDVIIFSFDGGQEKTYEKMRPGRFSKNSFNIVYNNIKNFNKIKKQLNSPFPRSKIQMVLTNETWNEQVQFFELFSGVVDEVTVTQYNERGGKIEDLNLKDQSIIKEYFLSNGLDEKTPYMKTADGKIFISKERAVCAQPFQRLLVTYDGRVGMCCHDWGAQHAVGYASDKAYSNSNKDIERVKARSKENRPGFQTFNNAISPKEYNDLPHKISTLKSIWNDKSIKSVREEQIKSNADKVKICEKCSYKDAYNWELIYDPEI